MRCSINVSRGEFIASSRTASSDSRDETETARMTDSRRDLRLHGFSVGYSDFIPLALSSLTVNEFFNFPQTLIFNQVPGSETLKNFYGNISVNFHDGLRLKLKCKVCCWTSKDERSKKLSGMHGLSPTLNVPSEVERKTCLFSPCQWTPFRNSHRCFRPLPI